jgi:glycosyltransferase involved in cell wall biosynthesis
VPVVTVIVAAKDAAAWLPQCLDSALRQQLPRGWDLGVAVGIDACPATLAVASRLGMPRLAIRFFPEHVGPYIIFNSLAYSCRSDVLVRFDADDIMLPGYLRAQLELLEPRLTPTITQTWSVYVDAQLRPCRALLANGTLTNPDGRRSRPSDGQFLMTRSVLARLGGFYGWLCHADSEFIQRAVWSGIPMRAVSDYLYLRRVHPDSLTGSGMTGYGSQLRRSYAQHIENARQRYARGAIPERLQPAVAPYLPWVALPD